MLRNYRHHLAILTAICMVMVVSLSVPAFADDTSGVPPQAQPPEPSALTDPPAPPAEDPPAPVDPPASDTPASDTEPPATDDSSPPTGGETGSTAPTGSTGGDDSDGPVAEDTGTQTPTNEPATPQAPVDETPSGTDKQETSRPTADRTVTDGGTRGERAEARQQDQTPSSALLNQVAEATPAETPSSASTLTDSAKGATSQIERNAESGVAASLVVTRIVSEIPSWVLWALAALSLLALVGLGLFAREHMRRRSAEQDAMVDELTGISNRKAFDRRLDLEWRRAARYGRSLGLMVMDLDGFKQVNDLKGHAAGDRVLRSVGQALDGRMRDTDLVARIGGDEFAVICPETGINELMTIRRQLTEQVAGDLSESVGLSIGVAEFVPSDEDATSILARADQSMYRVKRGDSTALPV